MATMHEAFMAELVAAVYEGRGVTDRSLRAAVKAAAATSGDPCEGADGAIPAALKPYLLKVSRYAYKVTDGDVAALKEQGYSEDAIFELTVCAAVGAGLSRLERGLAALGATRLEAEEAVHALG